jgi:hypothetical protein
MNQNDLWTKVNTIKRRVHSSIGANLSHAFRSTQVYQAYTGLCGEAQMAYEDGQLDEQIVIKLEEYATKVIARWQEDPT